MATMATLIHPRDANAQKKPMNPSTATVYRRLTRHEPAMYRRCLSKWCFFQTAMVGRRTLDRGHGFNPRSGRSCVTTLGKLLTPTCLDAESLRYYMESLNRVPLPLQQ